MARTRAATFDSQRADILAAAARLFAQQGYGATSVQGVAQACGVSKATLYHYVQDKHDLLHQVTAAHVARLQALVERVQAQRLPPREHLAALIAAFMQAYESAQHEHRVLTADTHSLEPAPRRAVLKAQRGLVKVFEQALVAVNPGLQAQAKQPGHATAVAMLLFGMMNWTFTWLRAQGPLSYQAVGELVTGLLLGGLPALSEPRNEPRNEALSAPNPSLTEAKTVKAMREPARRAGLADLAPKVLPAA